MKAGTLNHPKTRRLKRRLKLRTYQAAGVLASLWQLGAEYAEDGTIGRYSNEEIAEFLDWDGDPDELVDALVFSEYLDEVPPEDGRLLLHDWREHAPRYVLERWKKRRQRERKPPEASAPVPQCPGTSGGQSRDCPGQGESDNRGVPLGKARQGKERQGEGKAKPSDDSSESQGDSEQAVLCFPCNGEGSKEWTLTAAKLQEYSESYPGVDVLAECRKARQWARDNPTKRKTARGMPRFLSNWLARVQDAGGKGAAKGQPSIDYEDILK